MIGQALPIVRRVETGLGALDLIEDTETTGDGPADHELIRGWQDHDGETVRTAVSRTAEPLAEVVHDRLVGAVMGHLMATGAEKDEIRRAVVGLRGLRAAPGPAALRVDGVVTAGVVLSGAGFRVVGVVVEGVTLTAVSRAGLTLAVTLGP
ncbi:MAG: hypothetical protein KJ792_10465 [Actinobacteria bacterium]|nr:hypothetical protein [Actinomycetota bacterium]MCG2802162.1 hypothetical protein [Cellulomonas sp.]